LFALLRNFTLFSLWSFSLLFSTHTMHLYDELSEYVVDHNADRNDETEKELHIESAV